MNVYFTVCIENVEEDANIDVIKEKIEIALAKEMPFNEATVDAEEFQ